MCGIPTTRARRDVSRVETRFGVVHRHVVRGGGYLTGRRGRSAGLAMVGRRARDQARPRRRQVLEDVRDLRAASRLRTPDVTLPRSPPGATAASCNARAAPCRKEGCGKRKTDRLALRPHHLNSYVVQAFSAGHIGERAEPLEWQSACDMVWRPMGRDRSCRLPGARCQAMPE